MTRCAILSSCYYVGNVNFDYRCTDDFVSKINNLTENIEFCSIERLTKLLDKINTRLIDRQSLSLEAALKILENDSFLDGLNKSEVSIIAGSCSSSVYPSAVFNLSVKEKGPNFVNATEFTNTVGNAAVSRACIWNQFMGEAYAVSEGLNSGLDAIIDAYNNIKHGNNNDILACATEEIGAAAVLVSKRTPERPLSKPAIAYIKNCDSNYVGDTAELRSYFNKLVSKFNIELENTDVYLSGDLDKVKELCSEKIKFKELVNKNLWSLTPLIDIGRCLYGYGNGEQRDSLIFSVDTNGFVSSALLTKGDH